AATRQVWPGSGLYMLREVWYTIARTGAHANPQGKLGCLLFCSPDSTHIPARGPASVGLPITTVQPALIREHRLRGSAQPSINRAVNKLWPCDRPARAVFFTCRQVGG